MVLFIRKWYMSTRILIALTFLQNVVSQNSWCESEADCNYRGTCINDGKQCSCYASYRGMNCSSCAVGYFYYPSCYECSMCEQNNGICDQSTGTCICNDPIRFQGPFCTTCQDHYYGTDCSNAPIILDIYPRTVLDVDAHDGVDIILTSDNVNMEENTDVICRFESSSNWTVQASILNSTTIVCRLSNYTATLYESIFISVSLDGGNSWMNKQYWIYIYITSDCGDSVCTNGYCSFGSCVCFDNFVGATCNQCKEGYYSYPWCYECSMCEQNNGICDQSTGTCICNDPIRFQGPFCTTCQDHYYGTDCSNAPIILESYPFTVLDVDAHDGVDIIVIGDNLNITNMSAVICRFEGSSNWMVQASKVNTTAIVCRLSNYTDTSSVYIHISISLDDGNTWLAEISWNYVYITSDCGVTGCNHGYCSSGRCVCDDNFVGVTCNQCKEGHYSYPWCYDCLLCEQRNGTCDQSTDTCICSDPSRFKGILCDTCQDHHYTNSCLVIPIILDNYPHTVRDVDARDGVDIILTSDNVNMEESTDVICRFEGSSNWTVQASIINSTTIICRLSNYTGNPFAYIEISVSLDGGNSWLAELSWLYISLSSDCGVQGCNYGYCSLGSCVCYTGFAGAVCDQCSKGYFFLSPGNCLSCTYYCHNNGVCTNQTCVCPANFIGPFCDTCAPNFFGPDCLPLPAVNSISPDVLDDIGGFKINVFGVNFSPQGNTKGTYCKFYSYLSYGDAFITKATVLNDSMCTCSVPVNTLDISQTWYLEMVTNETLTSYSDFTLQVIESNDRK